MAFHCPAIRHEKAIFWLRSTSNSPASWHPQRRNCSPICCPMCRQLYFFFDYIEVLWFAFGGKREESEKLYVPFFSQSESSKKSSENSWRLSKWTLINNIKQCSLNLQWAGILDCNTRLCWRAAVIRPEILLLFFIYKWEIIFPDYFHCAFPNGLTNGKLYWAWN